MRKKTRAKRSKGKKPLPRWLTPVLCGVLAVLLLLLVLPGYLQHEEAPPPVAQEVPVYEDIQLAPPHVDVQEKKLSPAQPEIKKPYQYESPRGQGIALIIDDVGYDLPALKRILDLHFPVAISILPDAPYAREAAEMAHKAGKVVMLHMPMEPANPHYRERMDASFLRGDMGEDTVRLMLQHGLEKVPYVQGINNHMGSFLTSMEEPMRWVMQFCQEHGLFFVDSKTSAKSVAADIAADYGLNWGARRVFLDHSVEEKDMKHAWLLAQHCAQRQGGCIVIAHPHAETVNFLEQYMPYERPEMMRSIVDVLHMRKY